MFAGITCRICMVISQELISLVDQMGSNKKAHDISATSLVCFIGFHTLSTKHEESLSPEIYRDQGEQQLHG